MWKKLRIKLYHIKNSIKYFFKRNLDTSELYRCSILTEGGYMSHKTYENIFKRECKWFEIIAKEWIEINRDKIKKLLQSQDWYINRCNLKFDLLLNILS